MQEPQKILIVDDKPQNLAALRQVLAELDAEVVAATSGNQALAATLDHDFAVAILDVMMPGMDGFELAEVLRGDEKTRIIPIVFVTASFADDLHMFKGYDAGAIDYIVKPFDAKVLLGKVRIFLELDRSRRELRRHRDRLEELVAQRTRQINCLYEVSTLFTWPGATADEMLAAAVRTIPAGWRYPEITAVRITVDGDVFAGDNFRETPWQLRAGIDLPDGAGGEVTVVFLEARPERDEGPFLDEERQLIADIARQIGAMLQRQRARAREQHLNAVLRAIRGVNRLIVHERQRERLIDDAARHLVASRGFQGAWVLLDDGDPARRQVVGAGFSSDRLDQLAAMVRNGRMPACCRQAQPSGAVVVTDAAAGTCADCSFAQAYAGNAAMTVDISHDQQRYGWLGVSVPVAYATDPEELSLLMEIAGDLGFALHGMQMEAKRKRSEETLRAIFQSASDGILLADVESGHLVMGNEAIGRMLACPVAEIGGLAVKDIHPADQLEHIEAQFDRQARGEIALAEEIPVLRRDGSVFLADVNTSPLELDGRAHLLGLFRDITHRKAAEEERRKLQDQLLQAQKLESIGRLAGGVAHDYNNMLSVIIGYTEMALDQVPPDEGLHGDLEEILAAAGRSRDITRQLLAFARKQTVAPEVLDLNASVEGMLKILRRLIGEDIDLAWVPGAGLGPVRMDPSQLDQILANLCVNARDAIADVGKVTIETHTASFDAAAVAGQTEFMAGEFAVLCVSDSGCGMTRETLDRIFEPFYSTKEMGKGTGLGLATVYGIVKQNNGFINVYSEPGQGTTFKIYLPRHAGPVAAADGPPPATAPTARGETVLVVEDEEPIIRLTRKMLTGLGYTVLTAATPGEALQLADTHGDRIDLLITDVVMPEMNGRDLADRIKTRCPAIRCLYMSGYTANVIAHRGVLDVGCQYIQKPFNSRDLALRVRAVLDAACA